MVVAAVVWLGKQRSLECVFCCRVMCVPAAVLWGCTAYARVLCCVSMCSLPVPRSSHMGVWKGLFRVQLDIPVPFCAGWSEMAVLVPSLAFFWWFAVLISPCIGQWRAVADLFWICMVIRRLKQSPDVNFPGIFLLAQWQNTWISMIHRNYCKYYFPIGSKTIMKAFPQSKCYRWIQKWHWVQGWH